MSSPPFLGLRTVIFHVSDLDKAKAWYGKVLGFGPYFDEPFYVGFNVGGFELGLDPDPAGSRPGSTPGSAGGIAYWGVEDAERSLARLLDLGAAEVSPVREVGGGIKVATVSDPFGNVLGIIENPHFPNMAT